MQLCGSNTGPRFKRLQRDCGSEQTCEAVGDVDGAGAGQPGRQRHALQGRRAGLAGVLAGALLRLRVAVLAARLGVARRHRGGGKHRGRGRGDGLCPQGLRTKLWPQQDP